MYLFTCGDGVIGGPEQCDDGNRASGDGCSLECIREASWECGAAGRPCRRVREPVPVEEDAGVVDGGLGDAGGCGDGLITGAEECDDGALNGPGYGDCTTECKLGPRCGDAVVDAEAGEACDNGTNLDTFIADSSSCASGCTAPTCGDGLVDPATEQCDQGWDPISGTTRNTGSYGGCFAECTLAARCGDGVINTRDGEQCDAGDTRGGDGCSERCRIESVGK